MTRWVFNEDGWTDWIDHDGKGCPCVGWMVQAIHDGFFDTWIGIAGSEGGESWDWTYSDSYAPLIRYRVRKPKGAEMLEQLVQDVPEPVDA
jgi:hypothetical protein